MKAWMVDVLQDVRYALRQFRRSPGFGVIAVLTLAIGIGAAAAVFSVIDAELLRPLPYREPDRIVLPSTYAKMGWNQPLSWQGFLDLRRQLHGFEVFAGVEAYSHMNLESDTGPVSLRAVNVSTDFFRVFKVSPMLGRTFMPDEPETSGVAVLSYEVWQQNFGRDPGIVGRKVRLDGHPVTVIGVMPAGFRYPLNARSAVYVPLHITGDRAIRRGWHWLPTVARLKPGISVGQAEAELNAVLHNMAVAYPNEEDGRTGKVRPISVVLLGNTQGPLHLLLAASGMLLSVACANLAGLLIARGVRREREIALRTAVGAQGGRLVRQLLTESLLLSIIGAAGGIGFAYAMLAGMRTFLAQALARGADVQMNGRVLAAAVLLSMAASIAASLLPAMRLRALSPNLILKSGPSAGSSRGQMRLRSGFIVLQVSLSLTLLLVSGLLMQSLARSRRISLGFDPKRLMTMDLRLSPGHYQNGDMASSFYQPLLERVRAIHGIEGAALIDQLPIREWGRNGSVHIVGRPPLPEAQDIPVEIRIVSEDYFHTIGLALREGRLLSNSLDRDGQGVHAVVNEAFRRRYALHGEPLLGATIDDAEEDAKRTRLVGVVDDLRQSLNQPPMAEMDMLLESVPQEYRMDSLMQMNLIVRSENPRELIPDLRAALHAVDATVPFREPELMTEIVSDQLVMKRMESWIFGVFAVSAITLAMIGLYGLISQEVEIGTRDIGVRMALGATRSSVVWMVLSRVGMLSSGGVVAGLLLSLAAKRTLSVVVVMEPERDGPWMVLLGVGVVALSVLATLVPSRRAAGIDPMRALRTE